jgi:hypothetical protein
LEKSLKKALVISPHFPPINAPDMQRIRMSLPYYKESGWDLEVVTVNPKFIEGFRDEFLNDTLPAQLKVHYVSALPTWLTRKVGLGSLSIRSFLFYFLKVNKLLKKEYFDLVFFSTTMFHVGALGAYWKWRFKIPFVVDLQDPWRNDFYIDKPKSEQPSKFWFAYQLLKWTEAIALPKCAGLMAVSEGYLTEIKTRYPSIKNFPMDVIPFGASIFDFELVKKKGIKGFNWNKGTNEVKNVVYVGAITLAFIPVIEVFFTELLKDREALSNYHFYFLGTSYSISESAPLVGQLAERLGIAEFVTEQTNRIPYFQTLATLQQADILFIPGSIDQDYNASKVYNAILSGTPIFSIFHNKSDVKRIIEKSNSGIVVGFDQLEDLPNNVEMQIQSFYELNHSSIKSTIPNEILAEYRTKQQCELFNKCI